MPRDAGFLVLPPGSVALVHDVVAEARRALGVFDGEEPRRSAGKKRFLVNVLDREALTRDSAIIRFALQPDLLATVGDYLGLVPILTSVGVYYSDAVEGVPTSSQLYHCDADDTTQVKVFVYCSDVDAPCGPLTVIDAATTAAVQRRTGYAYGKRLPDERIRASVAQVTEHVIVGTTGTVALVDTSRCFHYGSRVTAGAAPRLALIIQYSTPYSFMLPEPFPDALPFRRLADPSMSEMQRLVLGS